jgi:hypothetical protein
LFYLPQFGRVRALEVTRTSSVLLDTTRKAKHLATDLLARAAQNITASKTEMDGTMADKVVRIKGDGPHQFAIEVIDGVLSADFRFYTESQLRAELKRRGRTESEINRLIEHAPVRA